MSAPEPTEQRVQPTDVVGLARAKVANNWAQVAGNAVEWIGMLALVALVAQCSTGAIW
jgi:hypothetical protein